MKTSRFRNFVDQCWMENCEERSQYRYGDPYTKTEYIQRFKWFLRAQYRELQAYEKKYKK